MNNRELKFRYWDGFKMEYNVTVGSFGNFYVNPMSKGDGLDEKDTASLTPFNTILPPETPIMQYTGIKDMCNEEIYEGDVVAVTDEDNKFVIKYGKIIRNVVSYDGKQILPLEINGFYFEALDNKKAYFSITNNTCGEHGLQRTWILGNKYENPELL